MSDIRSLELIADGESAGYHHIRVNGKSTMSCRPDIWTIDVFNPSNFAPIQNAKTVTLLGKNGSRLISGSPIDVVRHTTGQKDTYTILLMDGISFWESTVSQAVRADTSVQEAIRLLVGLSGTEIGIMADSDTRFSRGQTFFGSVRNHVDHLVSSLGCRGWISSGVFYMVRPNQRLTVIRIDESDLLDVPVSMRDGCHRIRTDVVGRLPGAMVEIRSRNIKGTYRLIAQEIRADNEQGEWVSEMTMIRDTEVDGWEGIM